MSEISVRSAPFELRSAEGDGLTLAGYAAVFSSPTTITERGQTFTEVIARGAFAKAIESKSKVVVQYDHGQHPVLGSLPIGRLTDMREDPHGLYVEARLTDSWMVDPIRAAIADQAITGMSFRFSVDPGGDTWDRTGTVPVRTVTQVRLWELGPVAFPAYSDTSVLVRSACNLLDADGMGLSDQRCNWLGLTGWIPSEVWPERTGSDRCR